MNQLARRVAALEKHVGMGAPRLPRVILLHFVAPKPWVNRKLAW